MRRREVIREAKRSLKGTRFTGTTLEETMSAVRAYLEQFTVTQWRALQRESRRRMAERDRR